MAGVEPRASRLSVCYKSRYQTSVVLIKVRTPSCMNHASTCFLSLFRGVKRDAATDLVVFINCKKKKKRIKKKRMGKLQCALYQGWWQRNAALCAVCQVQPVTPCDR